MLLENRRFCMFMMCMFALGMISNLVALFLRDVLPDFWLGYFEGIAMTAVIIGAIHMVRCLAKKRNPYTGELINK